MHASTSSSWGEMLGAYPRANVLYALQVQLMTKAWQPQEVDLALKLHHVFQVVGSHIGGGEHLMLW